PSSTTMHSKLGSLCRRTLSRAAPRVDAQLNTGRRIETLGVKLRLTLAARLDLLRRGSEILAGSTKVPLDVSGEPLSRHERDAGVHGPPAERERHAGLLQQRLDLTEQPRERRHASVVFAHGSTPCRVDPDRRDGRSRPMVSSWPG